MAVVINDFEVMPGEAKQERGSGGGEPLSSEKSPAEEQELERLFEKQLRRSERVWAH